MKKITALFVSILLTFSLTACGGTSSTEETQSDNEENSTSESSVTDEISSSGLEGNNILVAYFSATGNTETVAEYLSEGLGAELYEIVPEESYTSDDLDWTDDNSRSSQEHNDPSIRPAINGEVKNMEDYDVIFLGYPIWWGEAPMIVRTFLESYDFADKTIVPFCTSSSSGIGDSGATLQEFAPGAEWLDGGDFKGSSDESEIMEWAEGLELPQESEN